MQKKTVTSLERIIAKLDNDFNPDNSDWIPRVGAWAFDAMSIMGVEKTKRVRQNLPVEDRIAYTDCDLSDVNLKVYDSNGCLVEEVDSNGNIVSGTAKRSCGCSASYSSTGNGVYNENRRYRTHRTVSRVINGDANNAPSDVRTLNVQCKDYPPRYNVANIYNNGSGNTKRTYTLADCHHIELNFDDTYITIEYDTIETVCSEYGCELPVIPNNGLVIEAIGYYCMYKMLCRGYKHPVFNLSASQYGTNPFYEWNRLKDEAKRSLLNENFDEDSSKLFESAFFIETFTPRS